MCAVVVVAAKPTALHSVSKCALIYTNSLLQSKLAGKQTFSTRSIRSRLFNKISSRLDSRSVTISQTRDNSSHFG